MRRSEKRRIDRRRARRKALRLSKTCRMGWTEGNRKAAHLWIRAGGIRHQPRRVREILNGKRHYMTAADAERLNEFVSSILEAALGIVVGLDEDKVMSHLHEHLEKIQQKEAE